MAIFAFQLKKYNKSRIEKTHIELIRPSDAIYKVKITMESQSKLQYTYFII